MRQLVAAIIVAATGGAALGQPQSQPEQPAASAPSPDGKPQESAAPQNQDTAKKGLLPIPDYAGEFWERRYLTGDWGGARTDLAQRGITLDLTFTQVAQSIVSGGQDTGARYGGKLDTVLNFDLDRMGALPGALVTVHIESRYGRSVNGAAGTLLPVNDVLYFPLTSDIDEDILATITELRYTQFLSKEVGFFIGKFTVLGGDANEFAGGDGDSQFMSHTFTSASVTALTNPYSTLGGGVLYMPDSNLTISSTVYASGDSSTSAGFDTLDDGLLWSTSVKAQYRLGGLPGGMMATAQYAFDNNFVDFNGQFVGPSGVSLPLKGDSWNVFWNGWQYLYVKDAAEKPINITDGRPDLRGIGLFARAGTADRDTNPVEWVVSGGIGGRGMIPGRDLDTFGIGYGYSRIRQTPFVTTRFLDSESSRFEAFYNVAVTPVADLTFDVQYADSVVRGDDPAFILGLRLRVRF
ncbi:MAG: carbohydrate porin [Phycisphaerales bacterium]